jgi:type III secretion system HrpE/YscL family protein
MSEIIKRDDLEGQLKVKESGEFSTSHLIPSRGVISKEAVGAREEAAKLISKAREEAKRILEQARKLKKNMAGRVEVERKRGYDKGYEEGLARVTEILASATAEREKMLMEAEPEVVNMVFQIAEKILGDAVEKGAIVAVVKQALSEAIGERITVRVHPDDLEMVRSAEPELKERLQNIKSLITVADESIEVGGCAVDTEVGTIDAQLSTQLAAIKKSLGLME